MAVTRTLTPIVNKPSTSDLDNFETEADGLFDNELPTLVDDLNVVISQINSTETNINTKEASATSAALASIAAGNFQGIWTNQTTIAGQSWLFNGVIYRVVIAGNTSPLVSPENWASIAATSDELIALIQDNKDYIDAYIATNALNKGTNTQDPNLATDEYIFTQHANCPNSSFWHIRTQFYTTQSNSSNRAQIAIEHISGGNSPRIYIRNYYANTSTWNAWIRCDNVIATSAEITTGTDTSKQVTPAALKASFGSLMAALALTDVGEYAYLCHATANTAIVAGSNYAGSALRYAGSGETSITGGASGNTVVNSGTAPSGTWQARGTMLATSGFYGMSLFKKIAN